MVGTSLSLLCPPYNSTTSPQRQPVRNVGTDLAGFRPLRQLPDPDLAERGISPHRLAGADAEYTGALDHQEVGLREPDAAGKADDQQPRAPVDAAHRILEHLAADRI